MGLREGSPLLVQTPRLLYDGCGVAQQDRITCEAEDEINQVPMGEHLDHLRCGKMAVPPDQDMGPGPVATQEGEESHQDHRVLRAGGPRARAETGRHQRVGSPFENEERQIAIALIVMVIEGEFLLPMRRIISMVYIKDNRVGRLRVTGNKVIDSGPRETIEVFAVDLVFQPGERGGTG